MTLNGNGSASTYHSLIVQVTKRLSKGFSNQTSYTWSKGLGDDSADNASNFRDVTNRRLERARLSFDRTHSFRSSGTYELPFGPGKLLLGNSSGWLSHLVERWQFGEIANFTTGAPLNITANVATFNSTTPASNLPNIAGDFPKSSGKIAYAKDIAGAMYFEGFTQTSDPTCGRVTASQTLNTVCSNLAIKDASGIQLPRIRSRARRQSGQTLDRRTEHPPIRYGSGQADQGRREERVRDPNRCDQHPQPLVVGDDRNRSAESRYQ